MRQHDKNASKDVSAVALRVIFLRLIGKVTLVMFLPTLGLFAVGAVADSLYHSAPVGMLVGVGVGAVIAVGLLIRLIARTKRGQP